MMKFKKLVRTLLATIIVSLSILSSISYAGEANYFLGLMNLRKDKSAYVIEMKDASGNFVTKKIWKIVSYSNLSGNNINYDNAFYCLKAEHGFGMGAGNTDVTREIRDYNTKLDMKTDAANVLSKLNDINNAIGDSTLSASEYNKILWILDNMYIKNQQTTAQRDALLTAAKIIGPEGYRDGLLLTDEDIDVVQQMALWYFTNTGANSVYRNSKLPILLVGQNEDANYKSFEDRDSVYGEKRQFQAEDLYNYFITNAENNANYNPVDAISPITLDKSRVSIVESGDVYKAGPYKIIKNTNLPYTPIQMNFEDENQNNVSVTLQNTSGENITGVPQLDTDFYITIPLSTNIKTLTFKINTTYSRTTSTYYTTSTSTYKDNQPVVLVEKQTPEYKDSVTVTIPTPKAFDLSLRKSITKINGIVPQTSRVPHVDVTPLQRGENTAHYNHPKNTLLTDKNQEIEYTLTVYNEGDKNGYAAEIKDYLPAGIEFIELVNTSNSYTATAQKNADGTTTVTIINNGGKILNKYTGGNTLDSESIKLKCKVTKDATKEEQRLVNIAQITKYYDSELGRLVNTDRDSQINNFPSNLINNTYEGKEKIGNYVLGQEDDDDFEAVKIPGKEFDLSLRKSITKINGSAPQVSRIPQVDTTPLKNGEDTAIYNHPKDTLLTDTGKEIEYTFTVYNEGDKNGYAAEIKDYLPAGIEFIELVNTSNSYTATAQKNADGTTTVTITNNGDTILRRYTGGNTLDNESFTIKCKVTKVATNEEQRLVNVAEITKYYDSELGRLVNTDRDSQIENFPANLFNNTYEGKEKIGNYVLGQEDDDDFEAVKIPGKKFDLSLRKSITKINGSVPQASRIPQVDTTPLKNGEDTAIYNHPKDTLLTDTGKEIEYTFTVYNEGEKNGYAAEIKDYLPDGIEFVSLVSPQDKYTVTSETNSSGITQVTITNNGRKVLSKYTGGNTLDSESITIRCKVTKVATNEEQRLVNIAQITKYYDSELESLVNTDRDSQIENFPANLFNNTYEGKEKIGNYVLGQEDDDDFEAVKIPGKKFDLSLRKFIIEISGKDVGTNREPQVDITPLLNGEETAIYNHPKVPMSVKIGDIITYKIRVYNEGELAGYAEEITDHLPAGLEFLENDETNIENGWAYDDKDTELRTIKTNHLSKLIDEDNLIKAFDGEKLYYKDVIIKCKVKDTVQSNEKLTNIAQISDFKDEFGNTITDRDSQKDNIQLPSDDELPNYKDTEIERGDKYIPGQQDDDDFEKVKIQIFDLALRKFITQVEDTKINTRIPKLSIGEDGNIKYEHTKEPVGVKTGDIVTYTLRIFNEGTIAGYASEITDNLPEGLEYIPSNSTNKEYRWKMIDKDGNETKDLDKAVKITTDYLSKEQEKEEGSNLIKAFDKTQGITAENPDYKDVKIAFKVIEPNTSNRILINTAEISDDTDKDGNPIDDIDSTPDNNKEGEDDIDIEKVKLEYFDLALRKFIVGVNNTKINNRVPKLSIGENGDIKYEHTKEPVSVKTSDIVTYTLRIFNEGTIAGYASEITDNLPEGLVFLPDNDINQEYRWKMIDEGGNETEDLAKATKITTDYLSKEQEKEEGSNLIKAFDETQGITATNPDYKDVKIAFKVTEPNTSDRILINTAEISDDTDKDGKPIDDVDSTPDNNKEGEDDIDIEKVKVKYFDLALKKWVSQAIVVEDGKEVITETGHTGNENPEPIVKVDVKSKKIKTVTVKFRYKIKVTNEGQIEGYVKELKDYIPEGLKFVAEDNPEWKQIDENIVTTTQLENTLLQPGESATVEILLTWINGENNMGLKVNVAEISKDYNEYGTPDIDSTPDNKKEGEDDIDDAPVLLGTKTGQVRVYIVLTTIILLTMAGGIILIKKYVL